MTLGNRRACALAFLSAFAALFLQVLVHRIISAKLLNDYAFLVISLTMLGFAVAGAVLSFVQRQVLARLPSVLTVVAALYAATILVACVAFYSTETSASMQLTRPGFVRSFFDWMPFALLFALPFACIAFILGTLLAAPELDTRRIYFFDLLGSALGAVLVIPAIRHLGVETDMLLIAAFLPAATLALLRPPSRAARATVWISLAAVALVGVDRQSLLDLKPAPGSPVAVRRPGVRVNDEYVRWDPLARIELSRMTPPNPDATWYSSLVGNDRAFLATFERVLTQNHYAYAYAVHYDGNPKSIAGVDQTLYAAAYEALSGPPPKVVAIGVGGGFDILTALRFDAAEITGVEVNGTILRLLTQDYKAYFQPWVDDPRVHLTWDEGRHFLAQSDKQYDVIQLSGVDSYSGTPGAAHVFSENYLYTQQAFELYVSRLSERGILHMMRLEHPTPREMLRAVVTAVAALRASGIAEPARHIVTLTATRGNITSLLVKRTPFTPEEVGRLDAWASRSPHFHVSAASDRNARRENLYQAFLSMGSAERERAFADVYDFDITPTVDDRPFFFRFSRWWHLFPASDLIWRTVPVMEYSLILLTGAVGLTSLLVVWLPLRWLTRSRRPPGLFRFGLFFCLIGVGFMAIEMAFLQRFGLLLGHPSYALSVVLAVLLFTSGLGSWFSAGVVARLGGLRFVAYSLSALVLAEVMLLPHPADLVAWPFALRVALVVVLVGSAGFLMGMFLPTGLDRLKVRAPSFVPWAWGLNGIASVLAPLLSIGLAITYGNTLLLVAGLPLYLLAGACLPATREA